MELLSSEGPQLAGTVLAGKYRVERLVGTGGMGTVWEGFHTVLGTRVAIKLIKPELAQHKEARARFEIEARAAAKMTTKHAVHVFDYGVSDQGLPYIVMEYLEGESLSEAIMRRGPLPGQEVALIIGQAARALEKAHANNVVHRDLKPDNIFLAKAEDTGGTGLPYIVKLVDFGIAKILDADTVPGSPMGGPTKEGTVIGTPNFMAPEQLTVGGAPGPLTDLFSLGACAFTAMTGRIPFEGDVLGEIVLRVCAAPMPIPSQVNPSVPVGFDAWFARACARDPQRRFQTAIELADALAAVVGLGSVKLATLDEDQVQYVLRPRANSEVGELSSIPPATSMSPRTALLAGLVIGVTLMVGAIGFFAWREKMKAEEAEAAASARPSASAAPPSATSSVAPPAASTAETVVDAGKRDAKAK